MGRKAVLRLALTACTAFTADRTPVQDDQVSGSNIGDIFSHCFYNSGRFMPQQVGKFIAHTTGNIVMICLAHTAGKNLHEGLALTGVWHINGGHGDGFVLSERYNCFNFVHVVP